MNRRSTRIAGVLVALTFVCGCGKSQSVPSVTFRGNVTEVKKAQAAMGRKPQSFRVGDTVVPWLVPEVLAQSSCAADVTGVLACAVTQHGNGDPRVGCAAVSASDCAFSVAIELAEDKDSISLVFVQDQNGNGRFDPKEPAAVAQGLFDGESGRQFCDGDVVVLKNVKIDFSSLSYTADSMEKNFDACSGGSPRPTATGGGSPTATVTGTPPTPTPPATVSPTPTPPPTATPTCVASGGTCSPNAACCSLGLCLNGQCVGLP